MDFDQPCETHHIAKMKYQGEWVCPRCFLEVEHEKLRSKKQAEYNKIKANEKKIVFEKESLLADHSITKASFETYKPTSQESTQNLQLAKRAADDYITGRIFNLIMAGNCGAGKTHLAYSIGKYLQAHNEEVIFITLSELLRKIRSTFNKDSSVTEDDIITRMVEIPYLIIDDLGAELGALDGTEQANRFVNTRLFSILDGRQGKPTIITTNLTGKKIEVAYDERSVSRMFTNYRYIVFKDTKDFRRKPMPF